MRKQNPQKAKKIAAKRAQKAAAQKKKPYLKHIARMVISTDDIQKAQSFERQIEPSTERVQRYLSAVMNNTTHLLETAPSKLIALPMKTITLEKFLQVNDASVSKSFNRTFYHDAFVQEVARTNKVSEEEAMNLNLLVQPLMTHSYRQMTECETHLRCSIQYSPSHEATFDMTIDDYEMTTSALSFEYLHEEEAAA